MIQSIRKRHRLMWVVISIALPLMFAFALIFTPEKKEDTNFSSVEFLDWKEIRKANLEGINAYLAEDKKGIIKLILHFKEPVKSAFATVQLNEKQLGTISSKSSQVFDLPSLPEKATVVIFDEIDKKEILKVEL
ncbi:MAG: hypothetical protein AAF363_00530 [Bacteroidota bacterium]